MKQNNEQGFTLIELLIVITILGLISTVILVGLGGVRASGRDTRRVADLRQVQNALEIYFDRNRTYPQASGGTETARLDNLESTLRSAGIVTSLSRDPLNRTPYFYDYQDANSGLNYILKVTLENSNNPALRDDIDNSNRPAGFTINCDDPAYCIGI